MSALYVCQCLSNKPSPGFTIEFGSETTGCGFHIVNIWLVRLSRGLISLFNDNYVDNYVLKEFSVSVNFGSMVNNRP